MESVRWGKFGGMFGDGMTVRVGRLASIDHEMNVAVVSDCTKGMKRLFANDSEEPERVGFGVGLSQRVG